MTENLKGSCACGKIHFTVTGEAGGPSVCHCSQCRKMSGHAWASAHVLKPEIQIEGPVKWLKLSEKAERGICPDCGSFLFWVGVDEPEYISFALGAIDGPTGITLKRHIFTADKADYYLLEDGLEQRP